MFVVLLMTVCEMGFRYVHFFFVKTYLCEVAEFFAFLWDLKTKSMRSVHASFSRVWNAMKDGAGR